MPRIASLSGAVAWSLAGAQGKACMVSRGAQGNATLRRIGCFDGRVHDSAYHDLAPQLCCSPPRCCSAAVSLALGAAFGVPAALSAGSKSRSHGPRAHAAASFQVGIADEGTEMFSDPLWKQLHTHITRYIAPYDAAVRGYSLMKATAWIHAAEAAHQQVLVAFYHSEYTPTRMPSIRTYEQDTKKFMQLFPRVHLYQPWNETNRGNVRYTLREVQQPHGRRIGQVLPGAAARLPQVHDPRPRHPRPEPGRPDAHLRR